MSSTAVLLGSVALLFFALPKHHLEPLKLQLQPVNLSLGLLNRLGVLRHHSIRQKLTQSDGNQIQQLQDQAVVTGINWGGSHRRC